jgi:tetratricopeptide (TPR) repeat protein
MAPHVKTITAAALSFAATAGVLVTLAGGGGEAPAAAPDRSTAGRIALAETAIRERPSDPRGHVALGSALAQKVRETGDTALFARADRAYRKALRIAPRDAGAVLGLAANANSQHDFSGGLRLAERAAKLAPGALAPLAVRTDSLIELGRYDDAGAALQRLVDLKPALSSYTRVSYWRELHGNLDGAVAAVRAAIAAGGDVPEASAYVHTLLGKLEFARGNFTAARVAHEAALERFPNYNNADAELARLDAAEGRYGPAIARLGEVTARLELPEYVVLLAETQEAAGMRKAARASYREALRREIRLLDGGSADADTALIEAAAGDVPRAVRWGRTAWAHSPSVRSADALGWALSLDGRHREALAWARRALSLGTRDPRVLYHAAVAAKGSGRDALARRWARRALADNPRFSPLLAPKVRALLG